MRLVLLLEQVLVLPPPLPLLPPIARPGLFLRQRLLLFPPPFPLPFFLAFVPAIPLSRAFPLSLFGPLLPPKPPPPPKPFAQPKGGADDLVHPYNRCRIPARAG